MAKEYRDVGTLRGRFEEQITRPEVQEKWSNRAVEGSDMWETNFGPVYKDMQACGSQVAGTGGWDALKAYADCMYTKRGRGRGARS